MEKVFGSEKGVANEFSKSFDRIKTPGNAIAAHFLSICGYRTPLLISIFWLLAKPAQSITTTSGNNNHEPTPR